MYAIVSAVEIATDAPLKAFTLSRIFCATDLSSISRRPVPSTSQTPACAMFHKPRRLASLEAEAEEKGDGDHGSLRGRRTGGELDRGDERTRDPERGSRFSAPRPFVGVDVGEAARGFRTQLRLLFLGRGDARSVDVLLENPPLDALDAAAGVELLEHVGERIVEGFRLRLGLLDVHWEDLAATLFILRLSCASCLHPGTLFAPRRLADPEGAAPVGTRATTLSDTTVAISDSKRAYACRGRVATSTKNKKICGTLLWGPFILLHLARGRRGRYVPTPPGLPAAVEANGIDERTTGRCADGGCS